MKDFDDLEQERNLKIFGVTLGGGFGEVSMAGKPFAEATWVSGNTWEHVCITPKQGCRTLKFVEMCFLKDIFFKDEETVLQTLPEKTNYINNAQNSIHLWRPLHSEMLPE